MYDAITGKLVELTPAATAVGLVFGALAALYVVLRGGRMVLAAITGTDAIDDDFRYELEERRARELEEQAGWNLDGEEQAEIGATDYRDGKHWIVGEDGWWHETDAPSEGND